MTGRMYTVSDLHLGHENIIEYCDRPFDSVEEINETLITNWNARVEAEDTVIYVGDISVAWSDRRPADWLADLNGDVVFVEGNHDEPKSIVMHEAYRFEFGGYRFHCVHYPEEIPRDWHGWTIYGHHYNNFPDEYPFLDPTHRRINVSVELTGYQPLALETLVDLIEAGTRLRTYAEANPEEERRVE